MRFLKRVKCEFFRILPAYLFFLILFNMINQTQALMLHKEGLHPYSFVSLLVAAAVVAKVLALVDNLPGVTLFAKKPLIIHILWKTLLYSIVSFMIRLLLRFLPFAFQEGSLLEGFNYFIDSVDFYAFFAIQQWYLLLFFIYVTGHESVQKIGTKQMRKLFFGK